jgi:hypothetical protein
MEPPPPPPQQPRDRVSRLQVGLTDLCELYKDALGNLLNESERIAAGGNGSSSVEWIAQGFADRIVNAHREVGRQVETLAAAHRPEAEQLRVLHALQEEHTQVTEELRSETEAAVRVHQDLRRDLDALLDGMHGLAERRAAPAAPAAAAGAMGMAHASGSSQLANGSG